MAGRITVDEANESVSLEYVDDHEDVTTAPVGAESVFTTSDETVATVDAIGKVTPLKVGTVDIGATITGPDGGPILEPDGVTPFAVESATLEIDPGAAVGARVVAAI